MNANMNSLLIDCIFMYVNVMHLHLDVNVVVDMFLRGRDNSMNTKNCMTALWFANFFVGPQLALVVLKTSWYTVWFANKMSWLNWIIEFWLPNQPLLQHSCHLRVLGSLLQMRRVEIWSCLEYSQQVCAVPEKVLMKENRLTPVQGNPLLAFGCLCLFVLEEALSLQCTFNDFSSFFLEMRFPCALPWQTGPLVDKVFAWMHEMSSQGFEAASHEFNAKQILHTLCTPDTFVIQLLHISLWQPL